MPNTSTPARASRPGARAAHGPDAAADVRRFDEQLVLIEGARRIAGREHDDHHLPVPRTNQAGKAPSIGPDAGPHHTDRAAPVTMGSSHPGWATILPRPGCLDLGGQTEDRRLIAELRNDLHADGQPLRAPVQRQARGRVAGCVEQRRKPDRTIQPRKRGPLWLGWIFARLADVTNGVTASSAASRAVAPTELRRSGDHGPNPLWTSS